MNAISLFKDYLKYTSNTELLKKPDKSDAYFSYNLYLYVLDDKIDKPEKITVSQDDFNTYYEPSIHADVDQYMIFVPYKDYMFALMTQLNANTLLLNLYKEDKLSIKFAYEYILNFINWLGIDELKNKLDEAVQFLAVHWKIMNNINADLINEKYKSKYTEDVYKCIDCLAYYEEDFLRDDYIANTYNRICSISGETFYLNMNEDKYGLSNKPKGTYVSSIYYFPIDKGRSIFLIPDEVMQSTKLGFYKDGKIATETIYFPASLEEILKLINREDIYEQIAELELVEDNQISKQIRGTIV